MTRAEFTKGVQDICFNCAADIPVRLRTDTNEWVHDRSALHGARFAHSLCLANDFRKEHTSEVDANG